MELVLTLPFVLILILFIIDTGRVWMAYEGAKLAARDGAYTASIYHSNTAGESQIREKLAAAGLSYNTASVTQISNQHSYQANVVVVFKPLFGNISIPTPSGPFTIFPSQFNVSYQAITDVSVY